MSVPQWNADIITPEEEGSGTKVLDGNQVVQPTLEGGTNITISDGTISATGGGAEYTAGEGIVISNENAISITETVRSGAALGATAVQPAALNDYATTSALTSGLSTKQDTINDLETIRSGAAAGATAVQPGSLATVATTGSYADLSNKPTIPTVDQTYNASSTNAQSGVAVAQAIAASPSASYTAGDGIAISGQNAISAKVGNGLEIGDYTRTGTNTSNISLAPVLINSNYYISYLAPVTSELVSALNSGASITIKNKIQFTKPDNYTYGYALIICKNDLSYAPGAANPGTRLAFSDMMAIPASIPVNTDLVFSKANISAQTSANTITWADIEANPSEYVFALTFSDSSTSWNHVTGNSAWRIQVSDSSERLVSEISYSASVTVSNAINVSVPVPTPASGDSGKVLAVNSGATGVEWATPSVDEVPDVTSTDDGKVLTASYSGGQGSYSWQTAQGGGGSINEVFNWSTVTTTDIATCLTNGHNPIIRYEYSANMTQYAYLEAVETTSSGTAYSFYTQVSGNSDNGSKAMDKFYLTDWGTKTVTRNIRVSTPSCSQSDAGKVLTVNSNGYSEWAASQAPSYTAGDGIDITSDTVSVKAGTGLEIADVSVPGGTANLVSQDLVYSEYMGMWYVLSFAPLTSGLLSQMANGMDVTTVGTFYCGENTPYYAALYTLNGDVAGDRLVLGSAHTSPSGTLDPGTVITFDTGDIDTANSTVTLSQVESNISNYRLGLLYKDGSNWYIGVWTLNDSAQSVTTATYTEMTTVQDALCVSNPLPASAVGDAGKILTVNAQGAAAWGMLGSVTSIQQVNALPASPDANTLYLIPEA